ncbi:uncharacterized protein LOC124921468 [Impatiens glandulifera]|uniref:uncharacterized protein LOC124921468 n=1 Tax=Impatiens glandulifera TaxID=253017 RepID=UPI001FB07636|nr:uncharacterized protein LOC124921468 [Impatiens glandulifera]XP_047318092.1 uncharacterized protein LOC124921468 [Impatiens glandulifera]
MEANLHLDSNVLLPPRKRLLAGLKKQNSDGSYRFPSTSGSVSRETDTRIEELFRSFLMNPNRSDEEIVEASLSALAAAVKLAEDKRLEAEQKAEIAAKAIAAARDAIELSAMISEESRRRIRCTKKYNKSKSKMKKKQVPVQALYNKHRSVENLNTDEELARKLHQAINSSPRISKNSPPSNSKRLKSGTLACKKNEDDKLNQLMSPYTSGEETKTNSLDKSPPKTETKLLMDKPYYYSSDDTCTSSKKRSRIRQKKLPLSICSSKDGLISSECSNNGKKPIIINSVNLGESTSLWKCSSFKTSVCAKQDKAVQSIVITEY